MNMLPRTCTAAVCAGVLLMFLGPLAAAPQDPPQTRPTFRAGARVVPVDVRVIDKNGKPITDLTQADFTILEDGIRQDVRHFYAQGLTAQAPPADARVLRQAAPIGDIAPQDHRVFLILLGRGNLTGPAKGMAGLLHLVRDRLLPQDRVAVLAWNRATDFTADHARIAAVLERLETAQLGIDERLTRWERGLAWQFGDHQIPAFLQREIDVAFGGVGNGVRTMQPDVNLRSKVVEESFHQTADMLLNPSAVGPIAREQLKDLGLTFDEFTTMASHTTDDVKNIYTAIEYLSQIDGEKHLVWLEDTGIVLEHVEDDRNIARAASDGRVALSIIRAGGTEFYGAGLAESHEAKSLPVSDAGIVQRTLGTSVTARTLAEMSGGRYDANKTASASVDADLIEQASRFEYLLGYYPANTKWDGGFRNIKIDVKRPGATVLYRHGYFAREEFAPFDRRAALSLSRISAAAEYPREIPDVGVKASARQVTNGQHREVHVDVKLDLSHVQFEVSGASQTATVELAVFCLDDRQRPVGELRQKVELNLTEARLRQLRQEGAAIPLIVPVTATASSLKLVAYDYVADLHWHRERDREAIAAARTECDGPVAVTSPR